MPQNEELESTVTIFPLHSILKKKISPSVSNNFQEFQAVYGDYHEKGVEKAANTQCRDGHVRPRTKLKTITMEMPRLGSERAILQPKKRHILKSEKLKTNNSVEKKVVVVPEPTFVQKLSQLEKKLEKKSSQELQKTPSRFLEQTNMELSIAAEQLEHIKSLIKMKESSKPKKPKTPKYKSRKSNYHHRDCLKKNYITTLSTVQRKLQNLEDKYFSRPKTLYRSVNDTFTQYADVETLYESRNLQEDNEVDEKLRGIIQELDNLVSGEENSDRRNSPNDSSLTCPATSNGTEVGSKVETRERVVLIDSENDDTIGESQLSQLDKVDIEDAGSRVEAINPKRLFSFNNEKEDDSMYSYNRLSFKKPEYYIPHDALSRIIDVSESQLKKFRQTKQDIIDIEAICDKICDISKEDTFDNVMVKSEASSLFDGTELQENISRSCFLTKEFGNVKVFIENKPTPCASRSFRSLTDLIKGLTKSVEESIGEVEF